MGETPDYLFSDFQISSVALCKSKLICSWYFTGMLFKWAISSEQTFGRIFFPRYYSLLQESAWYRVIRVSKLMPVSSSSILAINRGDSVERLLNFSLVYLRTSR